MYVFRRPTDVVYRRQLSPVLFPTFTGNRNKGAIQTTSGPDKGAVQLSLSAPAAPTNIDTRSKRSSVFGVARPWMRDKNPDAAKDEAWRLATGFVYSGNALESVAPTGRQHTLPLLGVG